ncbi:MAG: hypothetical protein ACYC1Z_06190 [Georgenia sp.]
MNGRTHGRKQHLLGMLGAAVLVVLLLLAAGRAFGEALPLAALFASPLMMIGIMFVMGNRGRSGDEPAHHREPAQRAVDIDGPDESRSEIPRERG